jgi:hypothetical protein
MERFSVRNDLQRLTQLRRRLGPQPGRCLVLNNTCKCPVLSLGGRRETARVYCVNRGRSDRVAARNPRAAADFAGDWVYEQQVAQ